MRTVRYKIGNILLVLALMYLAVDMVGTVLLAHGHRISAGTAYAEEIGDGVLGYSLHHWLIIRSDRRRSEIRKQDHQ